MDQFRDFLKLYNQISDICFNRCANSFNTRTVEADEKKCVEACAQKFILTNHRIMEIFMEVQAVIVQNRIGNMNVTEQAMEATNQEPPKVEILK
ncbi:mitochondrial import inner membrane translocase subunit Tim10 B-like [Phymastichus coffea]|uniref:mitochondrial import inner membrane translocase subunit Tim10 B-like n=1 Tax=Phymastichus coffea TaxID=108790 RepID=UPI00273BF494|nr:mitochondrial import inner membrane translocase subunit Tim10 B-like [Phymastichus coffea]XP_058805366.1 mitochondrial import inner membrane translocase subunit Tim10 B-like [Phymastichus coffea]